MVKLCRCWQLNVVQCNMLIQLIQRENSGREREKGDKVLTGGEEEQLSMHELPKSMEK